MAVTAAASAREILVNLHKVMAARSSPQAKLDAVVRIIGEALDSEVCSIYLLREGLLELYATKGLDQAAVHVTKLAPGEGLVGTIAKNVETLNLDEAASHPDFAYRPETGEDEFHSFAGVPIIRRGDAVGVLAVQHVDPRKYEDVEIEALQTVAMVLSELIASAGLADQRGDAASRPQSTAAIRLDGLKLVEGMAIGHAVYHQPRITIEHTVAEDTEAERHRVYAAFDKMREQIDRMTEKAEFGVGGEHEEVLATYKMFAYDEGWSRRINEAIDSGLTAEAAIERVQQRTRMRMRQIGDPLLQDRMHDLEDLANRLLRTVSGQMGTAAQLGLRQDTILIARNLGPAELLEYDRRRLKGVVLEEGSLTAHVTIVARAMGVPVLGRVRTVRQAIADGDLLLLDVTGDGSVLVRPSAPMEAAFDAKLLLRQKRRAVFAALKTEPPVTKDGMRLTLMCNAGLRDDVAALDVTGADGIGLFRTEFQFLISATLPQRERQLRLYKDVLEAAGDKPVVFRTVDIGGDKALPYLNAHDEDEENPAMGWRALRLALERGGLMKAQARALIEAAGGPHAQRHVPDGQRAVGIRRGQGDLRGAEGVARQSRQTPADRHPVRRDARSAGACGATRPVAAQSAISVGWHQRSDPVPVRRRPRQPQAGRALRLAQPVDPAVPEASRRAVSGGGRRPGSVRGDGRAAARGDGADRARDRTAVDHPGRGRAGQSDGAQPRSRGGHGRDGPAADHAAARHARSPHRLGCPKRGRARLNQRRVA